MYNMTKYQKYVMKLLVSIVLLFSFSFSAFAIPADTVPVGSEEVPYESYTFWEEYGSAKKTPVYSKPMYEISGILDAATFGLSSFGTITDTCSDSEGRVYLLDGGASAIYVTDNNYNPIAKITNISLNGESQSIEGAQGIFVKGDVIYVADTENKRVITLGIDGIVKSVLPEPDAKVIPDDFVYKPVKIAVDSKNYTDISCDGSYYGALVYSPSMEFLGFYGANTVTASVLDVLYSLVNKLFSNDTKVAASVLALPYQFTDIVVGPKDFVYTATGKTSDGTSASSQVTKMNPGGENVIDKPDFNYLDTESPIYQVVVKSQNVVGLDVDDDGFFYLLDATLGRIYCYDGECNLMSVFGGSLDSSSQKGTFMTPNALAVNGTDVIVTDGLKNTATIFKLTEYGTFFRATQLKTLDDDYENIVDDWNQIMSLDQNNQLAYRGLAKCYYSQGDYAKAKEYAKLGSDRETYSEAFEKTRQSFLEKYFGWIFLALIVVSAMLFVLLRQKKKKGIIFFKNENIKNMLSSVFHPFESFRKVRENHCGSVLLATVILVVFYILSAISDTASGFAVNYFDASNYNSFYVLLRTVGLILLWTVANWLVCVLLGGIGKIKEIYIVTCYSLIPTVFSSAVSLVLSHVLIPNEYAFLQIFNVVCIAYTLFMLMVGIMKVHDFEFGKFFGTAALTVAGMLVIVFLIFLIFLLAQQLVGFIQTVIIESRYR